MQNASSTNGGAWATGPRARENGTHRRDTCQGINEVVEALVATGRFEVAYDLRCPDSGQSCKGVRLLKTDAHLGQLNPLYHHHRQPRLRQL